MIIGYVKHILSPLSKNLIWAGIILLLPIWHSGLKIAIFEVEKRENLLQMEGVYRAPFFRGAVKSGEYHTRVEISGEIIQCTCTANGFSNANCLGVDQNKNREIIKKLDGRPAIILISKRKPIQTAPLCYEIVVDGKKWLSYEAAYQKYSSEKGGLTMWFLYFSIAIFAIFIFIRSLSFNKGK